MATTTSNPNRQNRRIEPNDCTHAKPEPPAAADSNVGQSSTGPINCSTQVGSKRKTIKSTQQSVPFTVSHWNCASGITNKLHDIKLAISELKPTVLFISEANRKNNHDDLLIHIDGYKLHNSKSLEKYGKSRIIAYTRDGSHLKRREDLESPDSELIIFDRPLQNNTNNIDRIIGLYRPFTGPDGDKSSANTWDRYTHLMRTLDTALEGCQRSTILGDFNVDLLRDVDNQGRYVDALKKLSTVHSLEQLIHQPTRIQTLQMANGWSIQESLLDHIYTSDYMSVEHCGTMHLSHSDHLSIYIRYTDTVGRSNNKKAVYKRDRRFYNSNLMAELCRMEDWGHVFQEPDLQKSYDIFESKLKQIIDSVAPLRKILVCEKHPISNHSLRSLENRRKTLYKKMKKVKSSKSIEDYKKIKRKIKLKVKNNFKTEVTKLMKNRNMKNLWNGVNTICGRKSTRSEELSLVDPQTGISTSSNLECANILASTFQLKVDNLLKQTGSKSSMVDDIGQKFKDEPIRVQFEAEDIKQIVLKSNVSGTGPDGISVSFIKDAIVHLCPILKFIFDKAASLAKSPKQWKTAKVVPIYKKGPRDQPENYRPISLLCTVGKLYEKCLLQLMSQHYSHELPSAFQHGFRKNHSTNTAALTLQSLIARAMDRKKKVIVISTDMSAAFDLLDKDVLLPRMKKMGISQKFIDIYNDFLSDRKAYVECNGSKSQIFDVPIGCVQGSPSGPYLFTLLVDSIINSIPEVNIVAYADDMYFVFESDTWENVARIASDQTNRAISWLKNSGMVINVSKTECVYFAPHELPSPPVITIDGIQIELKKVLKVLGLTFDHKLKWGPQIDNIIKDANRTTQAIRHLKNHVSKKECMAIAHGLFFSKFYYGSCVWLTNSLSRENFQRLTTASNTCLRAALGYKQREISTANLHLEAGMLTPYQRCYRDGALAFWRILSNCEPLDLYLGLLCRGHHNERSRTFYLRTDNVERIGKQCFENRLNEVVHLLGDEWLDHRPDTVKKELHKVISLKVPAKI